MIEFLIEMIFWLLVLPVSIAIISLYFILHQYLWNGLEQVLEYFGF